MKMKGLFYLGVAAVLQNCMLRALSDGSDRKCFKVVWPSVANGSLQTKGYTVLLNGSPSIVNGPRFKALHLIGTNTKQFINITTANESCLTNLDKCPSGVTLSTWLKCESLENNMYFISSGGDVPETNGLTLLYRYGHFVAVAATRTRAWYVIFKHIKPKEWYYIEISWHSTAGLAVHINSQLVVAQKSYENRDGTSKQGGGFLIGRSQRMDDGKKYAKVILGPLVFGLTTREETRSLCLKPNEWATERPGEQTTTCSGGACVTPGPPAALNTLQMTIIGLSAVIIFLIFTILLSICILRPRGKKDKEKFRMSEKADVSEKSLKSDGIQIKVQQPDDSDKKPLVTNVTWDCDKKPEARPGGSGLVTTSTLPTTAKDNGGDSNTLTSQTSTETPPHLRGNQGSEMSDSGFLDTVSTLPIINSKSKSDSTASRVSSHSTTGIDAESLETLAKLDAVVHSEMDKLKKSVSFDENVEVHDQVNTL